jgi:chromate transport protein ChrA
VLPVALVISGLMLLSSRFSASPSLRTVLIATLLASIVLVIALAIGRGAGRQGRGNDGG